MSATTTAYHPSRGTESFTFEARPASEIPPARKTSKFRCAAVTTATDMSGRKIVEVSLCVVVDISRLAADASRPEIVREIPTHSACALAETSALLAQGHKQCLDAGWALRASVVFVEGQDGAITVEVPPCRPSTAQEVADLLAKTLRALERAGKPLGSSPIEDLPGDIVAAKAAVPAVWVSGGYDVHMLPTRGAPTWGDAPVH
jgi:hypothetical protein